MAGKTSQIKPYNSNFGKHSFGTRDIGGNEQQAVAQLRLKEEKITWKNLLLVRKNVSHSKVIFIFMLISFYF